VYFVGFLAAQNADVRQMYVNAQTEWLNQLKVCYSQTTHHSVEYLAPRVIDRVAR